MPTPDDFTGERFLPECTGEIWAEHWHRYLFAARHVAGRDVLDAACGEGYGAAWLARHAKSVTGLDVDAPTIAAARAKYLAPGLRFETGSVAAMPFADASFDCVVSFETLEHLAEQQAMLAELRRVLRPDGVLIISTPNKVEYSEKRDFHNEFHVRELYEDEFRALLGRNFGAQRWYGQRLVFNSALWPLPAATGDAMNAKWIAVEPSARTMPPPMYFVALPPPSESLLPSLAGATLLADPDEAMYREYTLTVARGRTLEQLVDERDRQLSMHDGRMQHLEALIAERESIVAERDRQLSALAARAATMEKLIAQRERLIIERDGQIEAANRLKAERERLIAERDGQLAAANARFEALIVARERLIVERDEQLAVANGRLATLERLLADRERIIVERDGQLAAVNARLATAEGLIAERERIIVERDGQLAALNARMAAAEVVIAERDGQLAELVRRIARHRSGVTALARRTNRSTHESKPCLAARSGQARRVAVVAGPALSQDQADVVPGGGCVPPGRTMSIDVIIPIYNAHDDLVRCIASVLRCTTGEYRLLLINDASPDDRIAPLLDRLEAQHPRIRVVTNPRNLGFIGTVNRGFGETVGDVVLLNSDTIVTRGWLSKMLTCAASDPRIATITPFSNNAEICSYPDMCGNHPWAIGDDPELPNRALEQASRRDYPDLPTAVGFCMYIRRAALDVVGRFDARYGLGYGEENDFCRRLVTAGFRNVLLDDTFVAHVGNRSFDAKKAALVEANSGS